MTRAVVLANGTPPTAHAVHRAVGRASLFVCADGGANLARSFGLKPAAIVGDLDSATRETLEYFRDVPQIRDPDTERTDTEKAIDHALGHGSFDEIILLGASAGRLDHVLGHVGLLLKYHGRVRVVLEDGHGHAYLAAAEQRLECAPGTVVSFFAVGGRVEGVSTENLRYPLRGATLELGIRDSISNVVEATPAWIRSKRGTLLVLEVIRP
jgi:thiamine pyrophosphokinase